MKKIYHAFLLLINIGCSEFPPTQFETENVHFTFSNYTNEAYLNATISIAEIINDSIFITETLDSISIPPKDLNAEYSQVSTVNSNKWEKGIVDLYDNVYLVENAQACYLIDLNGSKK